MTMAESFTKIRKALMLLILTTGMAFCLAGPAFSSMQKSDWRIKIKSAAVVHGSRVTLGDIAEFYGDLPAQTKADLAMVELWNAPAKGRKPVNVTRKRLRVLLQHYLGKLVVNCIVPSALSIQYGGKVMSQEELKKAAVKVLTPHARKFGGDFKFRDMKLPEHLFFNDSMDALRVNVPQNFKPGPNNFRMEIVSVDGRVLRRLSGTVFVDVWKPVPCPVRPLNRKELVTPDLITWKSKNMAHLGNNVWDGKGGLGASEFPWEQGSPLCLLL